MKHVYVAASAAGLMLLGAGIGFAARQPTGPGVQVMQGKPDKEAGLAALAEAERLAGSGSWELIAVGRIYYLSGDKAKAQTLFDRATGGKAGSSDWLRLADVYAEAGETAKADDCYQKALAVEPKDDGVQAQVGAWDIRNGQRPKGEELLGKAWQKNPDEIWYYVRASEALLKVPQGR